MKRFIFIVLLLTNILQVFGDNPGTCKLILLDESRGTTKIQNNCNTGYICSHKILACSVPQGFVKGCLGDEPCVYSKLLSKAASLPTELGMEVISKVNRAAELEKQKKQQFIDFRNAIRKGQDAAV